MDIKQIKAAVASVNSPDRDCDDYAYWNGFLYLSYHKAELAQAVIDLTAERDTLAQRLRMIISHATGGNMTGEGVSINDVSCQITRVRNSSYEAGKENADKEITAERDRHLAAKISLVDQVAKQESALRELVAAAEKAKKAYIVPESVLDVLGYQKGSEHE